MRSARVLPLVLVAITAACGPSSTVADPDAAAQQDAATMPASDGLPAFDSETTAHVRELVARGRARGNRHEVVAKIGDSITESRAFLYECGDNGFLPGPHTDLAATVRYFTMTTLDSDGFNSLTRSSVSAVGGWSTAEAIEGGEQSPLATEINTIRPQWALVMYGTNDLERVDTTTYRANLSTLLDLIEARDVVPVLSTIPPRRDDPMFAARVAPFNDTVRALARARHVPWMDYWAVLSPLPDNGLGPDGIHPGVYMEGEMRTCDVSDAAVRYGYNARNLLALQMLARLQTY